jgi:hypothetical protein
MSSSKLHAALPLIALALFCSSLFWARPVHAAEPLPDKLRAEIVGAFDGHLRLDDDGHGNPLFLHGDIGGKELPEYLLVGVVEDDRGLCDRLRCQRIFASRRVHGLSNGDRVLVLVESRKEAKEDISVLWGGTSPLVLQPARSVEERTASWHYRNANSPRGGAFQLETEASSGTLRLRGGKILWVEAPD